jgi:hypothetical protein
MTKQTTAAPEEKPTPELLRRFKIKKDIVDKVRKANLDAGLDPKAIS